MDIESYIQEAIFGENEQHTCFYQLIWDTFKESGFVITDEDGHEIDAIFKATIGGTLIKVDELANTLQACADCGAKKVLLPAVSMVDFATVPADLMTAFQLIPYQNAEDAVFKALGVE